MNTELDIIDKYNLSIRKIPNEIVSILEYQHYKKGDEIVTPEGYNREMVKRTIVPPNAGWYMVKQVNNAMSTVKWNKESCYLAPTLGESIALFMTSMEEK